MKTQNPIIKRDTDLGWEVFVPAAMLPSELRCVSLSPEGLYIETVSDTWDLISFQDISDLVDGGRTLDECLDIQVLTRNRNLIAKLTCPVNVVAGQPTDEYHPTGQERAYRRWDADQRYEFTYPGGQ